ncbi:MAG: MFS transporter [Planctomycetota bacterium]
MNNEKDTSLPCGPYAALRYRDCRLLLASAVLAVISGKMQLVVLGFELYRRTGQAMSLGWLALALGLPMLILGLFAGQVSDWFNRKRILMFCQLLSMCTSLALVVIVVRQDSVEWIYLCVLLRGIFGTFGRPARQALLPQMVPTSVFPNAVTWGSSSVQLAMVLGPALGGWIVASNNWIMPGGQELSSVAVALLIDAVFLIMAFLLVALIATRPVEPSKDPASFKSLLAGFRFVWNTKLILATITLDLFAVLLGGASYLFPIYAQDILHVGAKGLGWMEAAPAIGAICMAILLAHLPPLQRAGRTMLLAVVGFGVATIGFGFSTTYPLSLLMLFFAGAFDTISVIVRHTLVQTLSPENMRGRISAVNSMFIGASNEMGGVESAVAANFFGPVVAVVSGGVGTILVVIAAAAIWPQIRRIGSLHNLKSNHR